ncbi:MAG: sodium:alanine symporter family protein [Cardiobacteriaceae bacterium]|nr:sodium:alanine symporter family protein [Cardiobacteriaceae bacterium]
MEQVNKTLSDISSFIWGPPLLILLVGTGIFLTFRLLFLQFHALPFALKQTFISHNKHNHEGDVSHFAALMTALSATIGTGNIAGVATAVVLGGPGAVFWMWITALVGMATKYAECLLAVKYRITNSKNEMSGGPMYYIENGLGKNWKWLAILFALFGTLASFGIGSSVQANAVASAVEQSFNVNTTICGAVLTALTAIVVLGGIKSIARAASIIVPLMAIFYVVGGIIIISLHLELVGQAFMLIINDAFTGQAVEGAVLGTAVRYGVARGLFSNEAGLGSAPIAAAAAKTDHPVRQALVSMTGTFLDTIVVCSITGLVLVIGYISADNSFGELKGAALTTAYFNNLMPGPGGYIVAFGLIFFAYSTILGWCYYGEKCAGYLLGEKAVLPYRIIYTLTVMAGAVLSLDLVWNLADIFNGLMAIPNLIALLLLSNVVARETKDFVKRRRSGELY